MVVPGRTGWWHRSTAQGKGHSLSAGQEAAGMCVKGELLAPREYQNVATNGVISTQVPPLETQYVDSGFPLAFAVIAPFLADLDTSRGRGTVYYRMEDTWCILQRVAKEVRRGFPEAQFMPSHAAIITWEDVASYEEVSTRYSASSMLNTFQVVLAYNETDSYALFLYPEDGLQFFGTRPKNPHSTGLEIPARVGFNRGAVPVLKMSRRGELYYSVADAERSLKDLYQQGNAGCPGVWIFHIGSRRSFRNVVPATAPASQESSSVDHSRMDCAEKLAYNSQHEVSSVSSPHPHLPSKVLPSLLPDFLRQELFISSKGVHEPNVHLGQHGGEPVLHVPSDTFSGDEDLDSGSGETTETCAWSQFHCSQDGYCMDYPTGCCCHCQTGFYGNGQQCLPEGLPQRVSGKVSGLVFVGNTPVKLASVDLHAYIMVVDGRIHAAISRIPEPVGWALLPVVPTGAVFGWLFALEQFDHQNGFSITGAEFTCHTEVIFYPGNKHLTIVQEAQDLDPKGYLNMDTLIYGDIPSLPPGIMVNIKPYKEIYHYHTSAATSMSVREYTVLSPEGGSETFSYQIRQNLTFRHCPHGPWMSPEIQQLSTELVMVLYEETERALRYMMLSKVGPVEELQLVDPCVSENHNCHSEALCLPDQGLRFHCQCPLGYHGDGHSCHGTKMLECIAPNGTGRRPLQRTLNDPFALAVHAGHFYWTDWLRDGILAMDPNSGQSPDEYLPDQRHHPYGITVVSPHYLAGKSLATAFLKGPAYCAHAYCPQGVDRDIDGFKSPANDMLLLRKEPEFVP
ncbi:nidogen-2-like [Brienomyrus brachyistius]|uniref:nidogen-2-like n=1 Tax=Brienomyrus brachyistius TaxID=42636 RepID=UPI0020B19DCC|nr:nidogen-2-like [Brienomyrus brachyistius]